MKKSDFHYRVPISTRWDDNDIYGHVNNVSYYAFFDSAVNRFLILEGGLDIHSAKEIAFVVSSQCDYFKPVAYPEDIEVGVGVLKLGRSSVTYKVAIFSMQSNEAIAVGKFVHVFVNRDTQSSASIPQSIRAALEKIVLTGLTE